MTHYLTLQLQSGMHISKSDPTTKCGPPRLCKTLYQIVRIYLRRTLFLVMDCLIQTKPDFHFNLEVIYVILFWKKQKVPCRTPHFPAQRAPHALQ